ncbi:hypothetical protein AB0D46_37955 [Streptomyces sp. NPDC048383]|uniref:hypothetical protein n=1 Tax=Streptomyces sp. NPDC048383 TaxID=3155386 RepID=UPI0034343161
MDLVNGAFLVAPLEAVQDGTVVLEDLEDGRTTVTVTGTLLKTSSGAAAGRQPKVQSQPEERPSQTEMIPGLESAVLTGPARMPHARTGDDLLPAQP